MNCLRWRPNESWAHILRKLEVAVWLRQNGYDFYSECEFEGGGRADICAIGKNQEFIVEVIASEKELKEHKKVMYPIDDIRCIKAESIWNPKDIQ